MRVCHDTRALAYRSPYGAVKAGETVTLAIDVNDSPGAVAVLRTWTDGEGEGRYEMQALEPAARAAASSPDDAPVRYEIAFTPNAAGIVWYQFIITDVEGYEWRYGALNGRVGGTGQLVGWEPPSFQLSVFDADVEPPVWHAPINGFLHGGGWRQGMSEVIETMLENYPAWACETASPWGAEDGGDRDAPDGARVPENLPTMGEALRDVRREACAWFSVNEGIFGFWRETDAGALTGALFNASPETAWDMPVPLVRDEVSELIGGYGVNIVEAAQAGELRALVPDADRYALVHLWQFGSVILHFHNRARIARPLEAGTGVLAHITSLPTADGEPGTLGVPSRAFVDWLARAGERYWQVLPVNPTDECGSPYAGISAFAGNVRLLERGTDAADAAATDPEGYWEFCEREAAWLEPYACFTAIREKVGEGISWQGWPKKYRRYDPALAERDGELRASAERCRREQFAFERQWSELRAYANERGIQIIGDIPMYVSADSADVWAHPGLFQLDERGLPHVVAGCPPDPFAEDGQIWGNPVYDWGAMEADGYDWWLRRLKRVFDLYDFVRLDHFIGFSRYFSIPVGAKASDGAYRLGPGFAIFRRAHERFGALPIIAEDLGLITPRVRGLVADCGFPGMDIMQFVDGNDPLGGYEPQPEKVVYTGTHDNQTLLGYVRNRYPSLDENETARVLTEKALACSAPVKILPLQDILGLGDEARMNTPGTNKGNWSWQAAALPGQ